MSCLLVLKLVWLLAEPGKVFRSIWKSVQITDVHLKLPA